MAKSAKSDRRAVIDDLRKKQKGAERRRGFAIVGVCILIAVLIVGAAAYQPVKDWWDGRQFSDVDLASIGQPASVCGEITTQVMPEGENDHLPTGQQVEYSTAPPAFGDHWNEAGVAPAAMSRKFYTAEDRPELEALVHNLEHGYTVLWYDETFAGDNEKLDEIRAIARKFPGTDNFRFKFIAAPWTSADGDPFPEGQHVALTHWSSASEDAAAVNGQQGVFQYCSDVSGEALKDFMEKYPYTDSPEPMAM